MIVTLYFKNSGQSIPLDREDYELDELVERLRLIAIAIAAEDTGLREVAESLVSYEGCFKFFSDALNIDIYVR